MACRKCGNSADREVDLTHLGQPALIFEVCQPCFEESLRGLALWRQEFQRLLNTGVSRGEANRQLCERIDRGDAPPVLLS